MRYAKSHNKQNLDGNDIKARMYGILMDDLEHCKSFNEVSKFLLENLLYTDGSIKTSGRYQVWGSKDMYRKLRKITTAQVCK